MIDNNSTYILLTEQMIHDSAFITTLCNKDTQNIKYDVSALSYNNRIELYKYILTNYSILNIQMLLNIVNLLKNYNNLTDDFFQQKTNLIQTIEELVDIKNTLKVELTQYVNDFSAWYLSLFRSIHIITPTAFDRVESMPDAFKSIIENFDLYTLSAISNKSTTFNAHIVADAYSIVEQLVSKAYLTNQIIIDFASISNDNIK